MKIIKVTDENSQQWAQLCTELWPGNSVEDMLGELHRGELVHEYLYKEGEDYIAFMSLSARTEYVEG
jgi:hypothetical protein